MDTKPFFHSLRSLPAYEHMGVAAECRKRNANAYAIAPRGLNLPSGFNLTRETTGQVCARVLEVLGHQ